MKIDYFICHHLGSLKNNSRAETSRLTVQDVNNAHKSRWPGFTSSMGWHVGYTGLIFPDGSHIQTRAIGEELAANRKYNSRSIAWALTGNFSRFPIIGVIERPTLAQEMKLKALILACLLQKGPLWDSLVKAPGTEVAIKFKNIVPHRTVSTYTECYGNYLPDDWARNFVLKYFSEKLGLIQKSLLLISAVLTKMIRQGRTFGRKMNYSCWEGDEKG